MEIFAPQYYKKFVCRADKCQHSCCKGWEIDIDEATFNKYDALNDEFGERIKKSVTTGDGTRCFALIDDKCPFLNARGLCDIITNLGEDYLCQICADHPRFRNFLSNRTEVGIGLACEEASAIVLSSDDNSLVKIDGEDDGEDLTEWEQYLLNKRELLFRLAKSNQKFEQKAQAILDEVGAKLPELSTERWKRFYLSLERLEKRWTSVLEKLELISAVRNEEVYSRVLTYMFFRHILDAEDENDLKSRVAFCIHATTFISAVADTLETLGEENPDCESARLYSAEIEYSDDNLYRLIDLFNGI